MKSIVCDLSSKIDVLEIHTFADLHIGDAKCDMKHILERINYVREHPNAYVILNGDIINNATKTSVSDCYAEKISPMEQIQKGLDLFGDIKDKILAVTSGNHENRTYIKEGIDIMHIICAQLDIEDKYSKEGAVVFVKFGKSTIGGAGTRTSNKIRKAQFTVYVTHGSGGGRKEGAKAIRLADMASIVDADVYIHSHTHLPMVMKQAFYRVNRLQQSTTIVDKLFVNTSASLDYGNYGQQFEFKPSSKDCPVIYLSSGRQPKAWATL